MFAYVFMKLLEAQPRHYDRGLAVLSLGQSERIKARIIEEHAGIGVRMLEIGVGTGTLAIGAARKGAEVVGFDISGRMLRVARDRAVAANLDRNLDLREMGIGAMDTFEEGCFDIVVATLVFSELTPDQQCYALCHAWRVLRPGGRLVVADEVKPRHGAMRMLHGLIRVPLAMLAYAISRSSTRAVEGLELLVEQAGFSLEHLERSAMDSFLYLTARKE